MQSSFCVELYIRVFSVILIEFHGSELERKLVCSEKKKGK